MNIIVCIKRVPDTAAKIRIGSDNTTIDATRVDQPGVGVLEQHARHGSNVRGGAGRPVDPESRIEPRLPDRGRSEPFR